MEQAYIGSELDVFAHAVNWKNYVRKWLAPYLHGEVLEVGAGLGAATRGLRTGGERRWLCLEPDPELLEQARASGLSGCEIRVGMLNDLPETERFNTILSTDVLEHIEDDRAELEAAARRLKPSGAL